MPTRRGYPQRGGGYQSNYQYQQPATAQYESFFNPIPIDFLQQNLQQHQGRFDQAFAGALAAKEKAQQESIALGDTTYRNQLVDQSMKDMDRIAQEKYGGDYGRAAKDISREVTNLRADPFWNSSKHLKEQQALQQKFMLEHPDAHLYQDVRNIGAYDPDAQRLRGEQELTFRAGKKGDWQGSVEKQFADIKGDQLFSAMEDSGIPGYFKNMTIRDLKPEQLEKLLADNPNMVESFLTNNPDFERSGLEIRGLKSHDAVVAEATDFILGNILDKPFREERGTITADRGYWLNRAAQLENVYQSPWGPQASTERAATNFEADPSGKNKRITAGFFGDDGSILGKDDYKDSVTRHIPGSQGRTQGLASAIVGSARKAAGERRVKRRGEDRTKVEELVKDLRANNREDFSDDMSDFDIYSKFLEDSSLYDYSINISHSLLNEDFADNLAAQTIQNMARVDFYMKGDNRQQATKYQGKGGIEERTGLPQAAFEQLMTDHVISGKGYDVTEAAYFIEIPDWKGDTPPLNANGTINWGKATLPEDSQRIYFQPDDYTAVANKTITSLDQGFKTRDLEMVNQALDEAGYDPNVTDINMDIYNSAILDKSQDINDVRMIVLPIVGDDGQPTGETSLFSLNDMRKNYFESQTRRLPQYYFKRD